MYANDGQMPQGTGARVPKKKRRDRIEEAAAVAAGGGTLYAGIHSARAAKKIANAAGKVSNAVTAPNRFLRGAKKQLTTFPTFKKIARKLMSAKGAEMVELAIFRKRPASVGQDKYRKTIEERDRDAAGSSYVKSALVGGAIGALRHPKGTLVSAAGGAAAGLGVQAVVRHATKRTKDQFGERSHNGKLADRTPALVGALAGIGMATRKLKKTKGLRNLSSKRRAVNLDAAGEGLTVAQKLAKYLKSGTAAKKAVIGAGALGTAGAVSGAVAPDKDETRSETAGRHLVQDGVFGAGLYAGSEPFFEHVAPKLGEAVKKLRGLSAKGTPEGIANRAFKKETSGMKKLVKGKKKKGVKKLAAVLRHVIELRARAEHHSDVEARDGGGKFKDSIRGYIEGDTNHKGDRLGILDKPVRNSALRKAAVINRVGTRVAKIGRDAHDSLQGKHQVDERGRKKKKEWEKSYFKSGVNKAAIAGATLGGAAYLKSHPDTYKEINAVQHGIAGTKTVRKKNKVTGKGYNAKVAQPTTRVGKGIVKGAEKVKGAARKGAKIVRNLFAAKVYQRLVELDYYGKADWDLRDPRGKSARVFAPGSKTRERRPKKFHEKASNQRKIGAAVAVAGTVAGVLAGRSSGFKKGVKATEARLAPRLKVRGSNRGKKLIRTPDGNFYHNPKSKSSI